MNMESVSESILFGFDQVGMAASKDLLSEQAFPAALHEIVTLPQPFVAYAALEMARHLKCVQLDIIDLRLADLYRSAANHPHWWVRRQAADGLRTERPAVRTYTYLLADNIPAVVARIAPLLLELPEPNAVRLFGAVDAAKRVTILGSLRQLMSCLADAPDTAHIQKLLHALLRVSSQHGNSEVGLSVPASWRKLTPSDLLRMPAEEIALILTHPCRVLSPTLVERVVTTHPDPVARIVALTALPWQCLKHNRNYHRALVRAAHDDHPAVQLTSASGMQWEVNSENYHSLGKHLLALTEHTSILVVQIATRGLKECCDTPIPPKSVIDRLRELVTHRLSCEG